LPLLSWEKLADLAGEGTPRGVSFPFSFLFLFFFLSSSLVQRFQDSNLPLVECSFFHGGQELASVELRDKKINENKNKISTEEQKDATSLDEQE